MYANNFSTFLSSDIKWLYNCAGCDSPVIIQEKISTPTLIDQLDRHLLNIAKDIYQDGKFTIDGLKKFVSIFSKLPRLCSERDFDIFHLRWTKMENVLSKVITWLASLNRCYHYMALLQICSVTERVLGKIFQLVASNVPFLLRDLISTVELENILGKEMVDLLKVLIGSVHGFNFRNIAWHGFLGIEDIHKEHSIVLLYALHKCGEILKTKNLEISQDLSVTDLQKNILHCVNNEKSHEVKEKEIDSMEIVTNSNLVSKVIFPLWEEAVKLISSRDRDALLLLLPLLENVLRVLYATVNSCPLRILTATDSTFYITIDEILSPWIKPQENISRNLSSEIDDISIASAVTNDVVYNLVPQYLGRPLTECLYDIFHYVAGPRLRDRISHGELLPSDVPFETIQHFYRLCLLVLSVDRWRFLNETSHFTIQCSCEYGGKIVGKCSSHYSSNLEITLKGSFPLNSSSLNPPNSFLISYITFYETAYHPAFILKCSVVDILHLIRNWNEWKYPPDALEMTWEECIISLNEVYHWVDIFGSYDVKPLCKVEEVIKQALLPLKATLFSSKLELEAVRILQRISKCILKSLHNVQKSLDSRFYMYVSKSLRSRQRDSYLKQLGYVPYIVNHLFINIQMVHFILESYYHWRYVDISLFCPMKKMLKKVLKVVENLVSFTDPLVNNYHAAHNKLNENTQVINNYFQSVPKNIVNDSTI